MRAEQDRLPELLSPTPFQDAPVAFPLDAFVFLRGRWTCRDSSPDTEAQSVGFTTNRAPACSASRLMTGSRNAETAILTVEAAASVIRWSPLYAPSRTSAMSA